MKFFLIRNWEGHVLAKSQAYTADDAMRCYDHYLACEFDGAKATQETACLCTREEYTAQVYVDVVDDPDIVYFRWALVRGLARERFTPTEVIRRFNISRVTIERYLERKTLPSKAMLKPINAWMRVRLCDS
ncbi:MAG: hypothetical protein AAFV46_00085 [Cyanobacteria bacterium J06635_11]